MSCGVYPLKNGWYGDDGTHLMGRTDAVLERMKARNKPGSNGAYSPLAKISNDNLHKTGGILESQGPFIAEENLIEAAQDASRTEMARFVHDVYWGYIRRSVADDRLTFGLCAMLAFSILLENDEVRRLNSYRYVMIDEFQDTNANQLMLALMILKEPNLCVVGDWKQGIYKFRNVSIENITLFGERARRLRRQLNDDKVRIKFDIGEPLKLPLTRNYRSSGRIVDTSFKCLELKGNDGDDPASDIPEGVGVVNLTAIRDGDLCDDTDVRYVRCGDKEDEPSEVARCVRDYVGSGRYTVVEKDGSRRPMRFGDIAVLCRTTNGCNKVVESLRSEGIPSYLQGDVDIMSTREGKLALAWLRYVNNSRDRRGLACIMADLGYSMEDIDRALEDPDRVPDIGAQRERLYDHRRRINELLTLLFDWYGMSNDVTQAIINVLCQAHRGSLLTVSDLISIIEDDIGSGGKSAYKMEAETAPDAVIVMTMHKSKGLEFPAVIIPYMDKGTMPSTGSDRSVFTYDEIEGLRCTKTVSMFGDECMYSVICDSWRTMLVRGSRPADYSEERRLMFVAVSRAEQYVTLIASKPSRFMTELGIADTAVEEHEAPVDAPEPPPARPDVSGYVRRNPALPVHGVMRLDLAKDADECAGKGKEYGTAVHEEAARIWSGLPASGEFPESSMVEEIVARRNGEGFVDGYSEMACFLPLPCGVTLKGYIDLLLLFEDRVEVHDYKTDETDRFEDEYRLQLSVYAQAASNVYRLPARCYIDYVSRGLTVEFDPMSVEEISELVSKRLGEE